MNGYEYRQNNVMFDERLKVEISKVKREFKNGNIKTQTDYAYAIKKLIIEFYKNLGKPSFKLHLASNIPSYAEYTSMIENAKSDMNTILLGSNENYTSLQLAKEKTNDSISVLTRRLSTVISSVESLEEKINAIRKAADIIFSDDFDENNDNSNYVSINNGVLMLGINKNKSVINNNIEIEILDTSNGFPGNTHEIYNSIGTINNNIKYKGENAPHTDISIIKSNHDKTTTTTSNGNWFEFEMFNISDDIAERTNMIGFSYKEGVSWVTDDKELRLDIKVELTSSANSNYITLEGSPKSNANVSNPMIYQIIVSDEDTIIQTIDINKELVGSILIPFNCQNVKNVIIKLRQSEYIATKVCRQYMLNIDPTKTSKFIDDDFKGFIEVDKPTQSIELLGLKYDDSTKKIIYPNTTTTNTFLDNEYLKSQLFYNTQSINNYKLQQEAVDAFRYSIGVNNLDIRYRKYVESGTYISKTFSSNNPIKQLTLNADDYIPDIFSSATDSKDITYIKYYISFDNGNEWIEIYPRHKSHNGSCSILVNSAVAILNRNPNIIYTDMLSDPYTFKIKIELKRPADITDETPIVYGYHVDITSREDF